MAEGIRFSFEVLNNWLIPLLFLFIVTYAYFKKVKVYEVFVEGAKEGFSTAVMIIPYLVVIFVAIAIFRTSGCMDILASGLGLVVPASVFPPEVFLLSFMKPLSGSAARGIMLEIFQTHGVDSFAGFLASVVQGSTETTFYVIAVYFGAVNVKKTRHTIPVGLTAEVIAIVISAILANIVYLKMR
jgi:spore maturation protein B